MSTPAHITAAVQRMADEKSASVRELMSRNAKAAAVAERVADMIADQHPEMPGLGRALLTAVVSADAAVQFLADGAGTEALAGHVVNVLAAAGQVLAMREESE